MMVEKIKVGFLQTNCYFIIKNSFCIIVDPGDDFNKINKKVEDEKLKVVAIFVTHHHFDHVGALKECTKTYNAPIYDFSNYINDDKIYKINDFEFKIIDTRGHKDDLVTFYFFNDDIMFTGDFLFKNTIGRCDLEDSNYELMKLSIEKIKEYDDNIKVYPGHGASTNLGYEKLNNEYFK